MLVIFGAVLAAVRSLIPDKRIEKDDPKILIQEMAKRSLQLFTWLCPISLMTHTYPAPPPTTLTCLLTSLHILPDHWIKAPESRRVYDEIISLYTVTPLLWLEEFVGFLVAPLIMIFSLPGCCADVIDFFHQKTVDMKGIGPVCQYARFDLSVANTDLFGTESFILPRKKVDVQGKGKKDSEMVQLDEDDGKGEKIVEILPPETDSRELRRNLWSHPESNNGKMEMSLINFKLKNKKWKPSDNDERINFVNSLSNSSQLRHSSSFLAPPLLSSSPRRLPQTTSSPQIVVDMAPDELDEDLLHQSLIIRAFERREADPAPAPARATRKRQNSSGFS